VHCSSYGVALVTRIDKIIGLFCQRDLYKRRYSAKETYDFIDATERSHLRMVCELSVHHNGGRLSSLTPPRSIMRNSSQNVHKTLAVSLSQTCSTNTLNYRLQTWGVGVDISSRLLQNIGLG